MRGLWAFSRISQVQRRNGSRSTNGQQEVMTTKVRSSQFFSSLSHRIGISRAIVWYVSTRQNIGWNFEELSTEEEMAVKANEIKGYLSSLRLFDWGVHGKVI